MTTCPIYVYILHQDGTIDDTAWEMLSAVSKIDPQAPVTALVLGGGPGLNTVCQKAAQYYPEVWKIDHEKLIHLDAETIRRLLGRVLPSKAVTLVAHEHFGMDLSPGLSMLLDAAYLPDVIDFHGIENNRVRATRQEFNGLVSTQVDCELSRGAVMTLRPGSFKREEDQERNGRIVDKSQEALQEGIPETRRRFLEFIKAEAGEVDITQSEVIVSVGRGIQDQDNLDLIFDLAKAIGGDVACSRPIVDAKWLPKERQVGNSGNTVRPKVYIALGISGAFQHLAGIKGNAFIVAINKNPKTPFFQVADIGVVADILDFVPKLTKKLIENKEKKGI
jgi:electron transfer flavoprotein alpha subunit